MTFQEPLAKATVAFGEGTITFEGSESFVQDQVAKLSSHREQAIGTETNSQGQTHVSERDLIRAKQPTGHPETVAVLAFALARDGVDEFDDELMRRAYARANVRPPKVMAQALRDAKNRFDFLESASKKGFFKLSPHGDRTVRFDLPRGGEKK